MRKRSEAGQSLADVAETIEQESKVRQKSEELAAMIEKREGEPTDDGVFDRTLKPMHAGFDRVVSKVFIKPEHFDATYDKLMALLRSFEGRNEIAFWKQNLSTVAEARYTASQLVVTAERMLAIWEADNKLVVASMRERAYRELQKEKEQKSRNKTITDRDVDDRAGIMYPEDWPRYAVKRADYELTVANLKEAVAAIDHLSHNLRSLVNGA